MVTADSFEQALLKLEEIVEMDETEIIRDATIQRFEFTFELSWKALRTFLKEAHGIICNSPKKCFREGLVIDLYSASQTEIMLRMVDDRNETTHTYDSNKAQIIFKNIKQSYASTLRIILESIR